MISVNIKRKYKSIQPCKFDLPDFSVLTGLNGSGKTHLLEALSQNNIAEVSVNGYDIKQIKYIPFNGLNSQIEENCDPTSITQFTKNFWNSIQAAISYYRKINPRIKLNQMQHGVDTTFQQFAPKILPKIIAKTNKELIDITEEDLIDNFDISMMVGNDFFTAQFALIFKNYHRLLEQNNINRYYIQEGIEPNSIVLSNEEFIALHGSAPWDFVNKILKEIDVPYKVTSPVGTRIDSNFSFKLIDNKNSNEISSQDLSTGEKVLMSLALAIYNTKGNSNKPELLLIDEPDAALHPSMSKKMVDVLNKNIVQESNIPTIISSHSPTTIISSEGVSVYQMERGNPVPIKISVQKAIEILSSDIPFLKISNDRRRQVFVESKYDVKYYEQLTNIFLRIDQLNSEPIFLPARTSNGSNCTDVIEVVKNLYAHGNDQIYGIIDWDTTNNEEERLIILGYKERYSIENYLLDPLMMGLLFIRESKVPIAEFNLTGITAYSQVNTLSLSDAQNIINVVLAKLELSSPNLIDYETVGGHMLKISKEFNLHQGHELEELYKKKYPFLNVYKREDALKNDIIQKIINDFREFCPQAILETLKKIK